MAHTYRYLEPSLLLAFVALLADPAAAQDDQNARFQARLDATLAVRGGLTADTVARHAVATSFDLSARRAELLEAAAQVDQARAAYAPNLALSARYVRLSELPHNDGGSVVVAPNQPAGPLPANAPLVNVPVAFASLLDQYTFQASLSIPISDYLLRLPQNHRAARGGERAAELTELATRRRIGTEARLSYYSWVRARVETLVSEQALLQSEAHLLDARNAEQAGTATRADVLAVEGNVAASRELVERARNLDFVAGEKIRTALHGAAPHTLHIGEDIRSEPQPLIGGSDLSSLWRTAKRQRPELRALDARYGALREQEKVERAGLLPRLDAFGDAYYANPHPRAFPQTDEFASAWQAGAQLSWTISDIPGAGAAGRAAAARAEQVRFERRALEDSIRVELADALGALRSADTAALTSEQQLAAATESYRVRRALFQNGRATSSELLDAETELTRARLAALNARIEQRVARIRLAYASGSNVGS
jgi:outer membrane protein TolC